MLERDRIIEEIRIREELQLRKTETWWQRLRRQVENARKEGIAPDAAEIATVLAAGRDNMRAYMGTPAAAHFDFGDIRFGQLEEGMAEFYKDFRNKSVYVTAAMSYVRHQLKGKSEKELQHELNLIRYGIRPKN